MYGYIYITTNLLNGKKYIGKHKSSEFEFDKYYGSDKYIKAAIYLKSIGFNSITRDKVLLLAKNESRLLTKRFANLEGRIKVLDKVTREILWEN